MEWIGYLLGAIVCIMILNALVRTEQPRRGSYVMPAVPAPPPAMPESGPPGVLFHSPYCASRHGSPCDCQRCHCPRGPQ